MKASHFSPDIQEFIKLLASYSVEYLIVGGEAVIYYGFARLTGDVDFFYRNTSDNAKKLYDMLSEFWSGDIPGINSLSELKEPGVIIQFGLPPNRIDLINYIENVRFEEAWHSRQIEKIIVKGKVVHINFIGLNELIKNKQAMKRYKDQQDLKYLIKKAKDNSH